MLDQQQQITVDAVARNYNLITFDNYRTLRTAVLSDGRIAQLVFDHTPAKDSTSNTRHLMQHVENIDCADGSVTIRRPLVFNLTASVPEGADAAEVQNILDGFLAYLETAGLFERIFALES